MEVVRGDLKVDYSGVLVSPTGKGAYTTRVCSSP